MSLLVTPPKTLEIKRLLLAEQAGFQQDFTTAINLDLSSVSRSGAYIGSQIECHGRVARAMDLGRQLIVKKEQGGGAIASGYTILADEMFSSKGRFTRSWHAPLGGLWGCLVHANNLLPASRQFLPFVVGISCCEALNSFAGVEANLRWVNDVLVSGKKIAGFLIESYTSPLGENFHMIGFGININNTTFPDELKNIATSLKKEFGQELDLARFAEVFLAKMAWNIGLLEQEENFFLAENYYFGAGGQHTILGKFLRLTDTLDKKVVYGFDVLEAPQYEAQVLDIDQSGGLVLKLEDGYCKTEYSGEIRYLKS
ncbi:MAG: biotin--[acetyl-CoA-carboxylase] ligase [Desulfotalea sp.]